MLEHISLIVEVASGIVSSLSIINSMSIGKHERNNRAQLLLAISETLTEVVETFKRDAIPHGECETMREYVKFLPSALKGIVEDTLIQDYSDKLYRAHNVEMLYLTIQEDKNHLIELETAAGYFKAASNLMKLH